MPAYTSDKSQKLSPRYSRSKEYSKFFSLPYLVYIVPFSYGHNGMSFENSQSKLLASDGWRIADRADIISSREEDLYSHIYDNLVSSDKASAFDNNAGVIFLPNGEEECKPQSMIYSFSTNSVKKKYQFFLEQQSIFLFRTGIGFYVYNATLPHHSVDELQPGFVSELTLDELIVFQNRFKELNIVRGYLESKDNHYQITPEDHPQDEFYTLGDNIARKLLSIFGDTFYYPPRVNVILKEKKKYELSNEWEKAKEAYKSRGVTPGERKYRKRHEAIEKKKEYWNNLSITEARKQTDIDQIAIVPDKAILFSYVVMNTPTTLSEAKADESFFNQYITSAYYLTRGYKHSYKVAPDALNEKNNMYERHENDYWDASLEGIGNFILLYGDVYEKDSDDNILRQNHDHFYDSIRTREMHGDYFLLYMLLLYQHYSIVYFSQKISETVPMNADVFKQNHFDEANSSALDEIYKHLHDLKVEVDVFFANNMYDAVSQITDLCNIYSYIESKLQIKKNSILLQDGISRVDNLLTTIVQEKALEAKRKEEAEQEERIRKEEALQEEIRLKEEAKTKKYDKIISCVGVLAIISVILDALQLIDLINQKTQFVMNGISVGLSVLDVVFLTISVLVFIVLVVLGIIAFHSLKKR